MIDWDNDGKIDAKDTALSYASYRAMADDTHSATPPAKNLYGFQAALLIFVLVGAPIAFFLAVVTLGFEETLSSAAGICCGIITLIELIVVTVIVTVVCGNKK